MNLSLLFKRKWTYLFSTLIFWGITFTGLAQCGGPSFPAPADILSNVPEASGYNLVYQLPIPSANQAWTSQANVPYSVNNSAALGSSGYTRVAYYLKLESPSLGVQWAWVSMNSFSNDILKIGIPTGDIFFQQQVTGMNVLNYAGVNRNAVVGNIELWSSCYNPDNSAAVPGASGTVSDFGDAPIAGTNCYGSFQLHDFNASETLLAYNGWAFSGFGGDDLGIGNCAFSSNTDWTAVGNAGLFTVKELYVFVNSTSFQPTCNNASLNLDAAGNATLTAAMVTTATIGNCGVENIQLSKTNFTCADLGSNTVTVTFTINGNTTSCNASVNVNDVTVPVIEATGSSLNLTCNPSSQAIEAALGTATATDNCGTPSLLVNTSAVVLNGNVFSQTRSWTASDGTNMASASRTATWTNENSVPVIITTGTTLTLGCNPTAAAIEAALGTATASATCGTTTLSVSTAAVILTGNTFSQTRTWTAVNGTNTVTASRTVSWPQNNAPVITATGTTLTLGCNPTAAAINAALGTATAVDDCGTATLSVSNSAITLSGNTFSQTRTFTATDGINTATASRTVSWPKDVTAPVITVTGTGLSLACNPSAAAINAALGTATAVDDCGTATVTVSTSGITLNGNTFSQTRTFTATDGVNSASISRTATWPKDITAPVIIATGTTLALGCNPTSAAIEAALGTATASDNCSTPTLSITTTAVVSSGNNRSQTRTWTATDPALNSSSVSRTVTWTVNCVVNTPHTFSSSVSCEEFNAGSSPLLNVCYKAENRKVKKVSPKTFYYYTNVTAPSSLGILNSFYVDIIQTKSCSGFKLYEIQGNQVRAYDNRCRNSINGREVSEGQGRVWIYGATPGREYTISVKYQTKSLEGSTYTGNVAPVCENSFVARITQGSFGTGNIVPGSQGTLKAMPGCYNQNDDDDDDNDDDDDDDDDDRNINRQQIVSAELSVECLTVMASPNPSASSFTVSIKSNVKTPVTVKVIDILGRPVYASKGIVANSTLQLGSGWLPGSYVVEIMQGEQRKLIRLIKQ